MTTTLAPAPSVAHLDTLLASRPAGDVRLRATGDPRALPATLELTAYRIVEHLIGALGSRAATVDVTLTFLADALELEDADPVAGGAMHPLLTLLAAVALATASGGALAQNFMKDKAEVEKLLTGATFIGVYLRTEAAYTLQFGTDGTLTDTTGAKARWWVDDQARYCREWLDGKLKGNTGCMNLELEDGQVALYSEGKKVVEGIVTGK